MRPENSYKLKRSLFYGMVSGIGILAIVGTVQTGDWVYRTFIKKDDGVKQVYADSQVDETKFNQAWDQLNARNFIFNWFTVKSDEKMNDRLERLNIYVTPEFQSYLADNPQMLPQLQDEKKTATVRSAEWVTKSWIKTDQEVLVKLRMIMEDGRLLYVQLPMEKRGEMYLVSGLPGLVPAPEVKQGPEKEEAPDLGGDQAMIAETLNNFFSSWLTGNHEQNMRYAVKRIPSSNLLKDMAALYKGVEVEPLSDEPVKVKALVKLEDGNKMLTTLEYIVTMEKKDGTWMVKDIEM